jgi:hypothetical protein
MWRIERARKLLSGIHFDAKGRKFSTQGKQRVKKQVKGKDGKTFMQTFWVKGEQKATPKIREVKGADFEGKKLSSTTGGVPLVIVKDLGIGEIEAPTDRPKEKAFAYSHGNKFDDRPANFAYLKSDDQFLPGIVTTDEYHVYATEDDFEWQGDQHAFLSSTHGGKVLFEPKTNTVWRAEDFPLTKSIDKRISADSRERIIDTALRLGVQHGAQYSPFSQLEANALGKEVARKGLTMALSDPGSKEHEAFVSYQKLRQAASKNKWVKQEQLEVLDAFFASGAFARGEIPTPMSEKQARRELESFYLDKGKPLSIAHALSNSVIERARKRGVPMK